MSLTILPIIQARYNSSRLPGKVAKPFSNQKTTLDAITETLRSLQFDHIVLATTTDAADDILAKTYENKIDVYRGSEKDVLSRFTDVIKKYEPDYVIRICADNPFLFKEGIQFLVEQIKHHPDDRYLSFKIWDKPSMKVPFGIFTELVRASALLDRGQKSDPLDLEHVTINLYGDQVSQHTLFDFEKYFVKVPQGMRLTVDTPEDFSYIDTIIKGLQIHTPVDTEMLQKIVRYSVDNNLVQLMQNENEKSINSKNYFAKKDSQ